MKKLCLIAAFTLLLCLPVAVTAASTDNADDADTVEATEATASTVNDVDPDTGEAAETTVTTANDDDTGEATDTAEANTAEAETAFPRYDYFAADVLPDVSVTKDIYKELTFELPGDLLVDREDVMKYINYLMYQERKASNGTEKMTDKPLKMGDSAFIYYKGTIDGVAFDGGSNMGDAKPYELGLGSGNFIPGFEEGLVGVIPKDTTTKEPFPLKVTFPESYGKAELAGKEAVFYVVVEYAVQYDMPEYTRDFVENTLKFSAKKQHVTDGSYLAEFEDYVKDYLTEQNASSVESTKTDKLWTYLTDTLECRNLPEMELTYYRETYKKEVQSAYDYYCAQNGDTFKAIYPTVGDFGISYLGLSAGSNWEEELTKLAEKMVKKDMIIHAIGEMEGMETVSDSELAKEIDYWIQYYGGYVTKDEVLKNIGEAYLKESAYAVKMYDYLIAKATFTYSETNDSEETEASEDDNGCVSAMGMSALSVAVAAMVPAVALKKKD